MSEKLREAAREASIAFHVLAGPECGHAGAWEQCATHACVDDQMLLAAQPSEPGLDVEARALSLASRGTRVQMDEAEARRLLAESARLASEPTEFMRDPENHTQEADANGVWCRACQQQWPCDTIRALHAALAPEPTDERA